MPRGGARPGAGRKRGSGKVQDVKPAPAADTISPRPRFASAQAFGLWALNAPEAEVSMDQKLRAMQVLAMIETKKPAEGGTKKEQAQEAVEGAMSGLYAPRRVKGFGVVNGGKGGAANS